MPVDHRQKFCLQISICLKRGINQANMWAQQIYPPICTTNFGVFLIRSQTEIILDYSAGLLTIPTLIGKTFVPSPGIGVTLWQSILVEILFTFALCSVILAVATSKKLEGNYIYGLAIGFTLAVGAFAGGNISGGTYNPAVALGPMILKSLLGVQNWNNLIIYLIGPFAGAILAALAFKYLNPKDA